MTQFNQVKSLFSLLLCTYAVAIQAITFTPESINRNNETDYLKFEGRHYKYSNAFEKVVADFNGDGFDDILSLGGNSNSSSSITPDNISIPLEMMLYHQGSYITHELNINDFSSTVNIVDIDVDGDLDIVLMNGKIAINNGQAHFTVMTFASDINLSDGFFTADIDTDGDLDIIAKNHFYINDGTQQFEPMANNTSTSSNLLHVADINHDHRVDLLTVKNNQIQTWINDGSGNFELLETLQTPDDVFMIHSLDTANGGHQNLSVVYHENFQDKILLLKNDGNGHFDMSPLELMTDTIAFDVMRINRLYNQDINNDGVQDLWIASTFTDTMMCANSQNLLSIYSPNDDGQWQHHISLHSEGRMTDNSLEETITSLPTIIDLNNDRLPDVVFNGETPQTWLNDETTDNQINSYFHLSLASKDQYTQFIDQADYDNDGDKDIIVAAQYNGNCPAINTENTVTAIQQINSRLLINNGEGSFDLLSSQSDAENNFLRPYEYAIFADLENDGQPNIIATTAANDQQPKQSHYIYPQSAGSELSIQLPEATINAKVANIDKTTENQEIVMIADTQNAPIVVLARDNDHFSELARLEFGERNGEFILADMDNDGNIDIITSKNSGQQNATTIWYNNGTGQFSESQTFADNAFGIAVLDFNSDGLLDLFSSSREIRLNRDNRSFEKIQYDSSFWTTPLGLPILSFLVPKGMQVTDFNNDGKDDIIFTNYRNYYVYINESSQDQIVFYMAYSNQFSTSNDQYNAVLADFNNDNKTDFMVNTGNAIHIHSQVQEIPTVGLYYDRNHNGHGFSITEIGRNNLYHSVFYSYDQQGKPQWFSTLGRYTGYETHRDSAYYFTRVDKSDTIRYLYDYDSNSIQADSSPQYQGNLIFSNNNHTDSLDGMYYIIGDEFNNWDIQPLIGESQKPEMDLSGIWWAGPNDSGWGVSLSFAQREDSQHIIVVLYFYDENGEPRWLIGQQQGFELNSDISVPMNQINGYPRDNNAVELTQFSAGTISLNLKQASKDLTEAGHMTMDVFYPDDQSSHKNWVRNNIPIALFSQPRN